MFKIRFAVTAYEWYSTASSGSVPEKTMSGLLDVIDDPTIR